MLTHLLQLLKNYHSERSQVVRVNSALSGSVTMHSGKPQGSVLGPWLFVAYIVANLELSPCSHVILYADDLVIIHYMKSSLCSAHIQSDLSMVATHLNQIPIYLMRQKLKTRTIYKRPWHPTVCARPVLLTRASKHYNGF